MEIYLVLQRLVNIPSADKELEVQLYLRMILEQLGFSVRLDDVYPDRPNLWASRGEGGPLVVSHADTFPRGDHPDPFHLRDLDGRFVGRGALDAKGQIAALVKAASLSVKPCRILITVDEERAGKGSEVAMPPVEGAIVLEPTALGIAVAQAGFIESEITVHGKSAHGSIPEAGTNAILKAFGLYDKMQQLSFMSASHHLFPAPWANLVSIRSGGQSIVVPASCTMQTDLAVLPGVAFDSALKEFEAFLQREEAHHRLVDSSPPFEIEPSTKVVSTLMGAFQQVAGVAPRMVGMRSWTDAANIVGQEIPAAVFGAGDLALAHSGREEIDVGELETLASTLAAFIDLW